MPVDQSKFDCLLITRPSPEAGELAGRLDIPGLTKVLQPAHEFSQLDVGSGDIEALQAAALNTPAPLLVFTSTRAVHFGLRQLPMELLLLCRLAAIGQATAAALHQAGLRDVRVPAQGYLSEDLLLTLDERGIEASSAWIVAAAGGRQALLEGLRQRGLDARMLLVYQRQPAASSAQCRRQLAMSNRILSVWTSANAMQQLSRELSGPAWNRVRAGEWLVISARLATIAAAYNPALVHQARGPGNAELAAAIERICFAAVTGSGHN